jgi:hypothetical protein
MESDLQYDKTPVSTFSPGVSPMKSSADRFVHHNDHCVTVANCPPLSAMNTSADASDAPVRRPDDCTEARLHTEIERRAYLRAEQRGFAPGHECDDWLAAEAELAGLWFVASPAELSSP